MRLFVCPRFTLSLSGTHTLRSLLRSLRYVLPSEGVAVSVNRYCIARGKAHTGPGTHLPRGCAEAPYAALQEKTSPLTRRIVPSKFHMSPASRTDARNCLNSLPPESPSPLRRLSIRPVAQTDGIFGQASSHGPETSGNVLNRSLRCFLPRAAFDPKAGAHRLVNSPDTKTCLCCPPGCACPLGCSQ